MLVHCMLSLHVEEVLTTGSACFLASILSTISFQLLCSRSLVLHSTLSSESLISEVFRNHPNGANLSSVRFFFVCKLYAVKSQLCLELCF